MSGVRTKRPGPQTTQVFQLDHGLPQTQQALTVGPWERASAVVFQKLKLLEEQGQIGRDQQSHSRLLPSPGHGILPATLQGINDLVIQMRKQIREVKETA